MIPPRPALTPTENVRLLIKQGVRDRKINEHLAAVRVKPTPVVSIITPVTPSGIKTPQENADQAALNSNLSRQGKFMQ